VTYPPAYSEWGEIMGLSTQIRRQLIDSFKTEQQEHIQKINTGLLALEKNPPEAEERQAILNEIFREAHSLKGAARALEQSSIESLGHALESLLLSAKEGYLTFAPELFDLLYQTLDAIELMVAQVEAGNATPPTKIMALLARLEAVIPEARTKEEEIQENSETEEPGWPQNDEIEAEITILAEASSLPNYPISPTSDETIRVSVNKLDALMDQFSELLGAKIRTEQRLAEMHQFQMFAAAWHKDWMALRSNCSGLLRNGQQTHNKEFAALLDFTQKNQERLRLFNVQSNTLYRQMANDTQRLSLVIDELQEEIKRIRMLPLSTITTLFGRMVRDLAREQGKQITLTISGGETELDKRVLEQIKDPLTHLLRNATDHGLEIPLERQQMGKPAEGQIVLAASQQGNNVVITVRDDGNGLDISAIRLAAVRKGMLSKVEVEKLSEAEVANLVFSSGLSTSKIITDISGRGVGLDVVRQNVEQLHGTLDVSFGPGQGTTFTMTLPLTLASSRGLLIQANQQTFALPLTTVERMLHVERSAIAAVEGREAITYQGKPITLVWLEDLLELPPGSKEAETLTVVIVAVAEKRLGLIVDSLVGEQEIVMKSLGKQLAKVGGIAGATVLGSGQVILVLHAADLVKLAGRITPRPSVLTQSKPNESHHHKTILVVDDPITTRTLEKNIMEAAGYQVKLATNGEEALAALLAEDLPDLIVSDVNMPRLDGFGLTHRLRQDKRYAAIPVILVTSLDSPADKARGIEVGADAYIVKSSFDQVTLLETVEQLI
jgi:two-component system, chemotaxis family, sensor kinase CheA